MDYVVLTRNPNGNVVIIDDGAGEFPNVAVFDSVDEADEMADRQPLCLAWGWQVVELEL